MKLNAIAGLFIAIGVGLLGFSVKTHLEAAGPECDGCAPFHPLFVIAPVVAGGILTLAGVYVARRQGSRAAIGSTR